MKKTICTTIAFLVFICLTVAHQASGIEKPVGYPKNAIELVITSGPGTGSELTSRALFAGIDKVLGVPIQFIYKPGANATIGTAYAMSQQADGHTILLVSTDNSINMALHKDPYGVNDYAYIINAIHEISALHTRVDNKQFRTIQDVLNYCKKNPKEKVIVAGADAMGIDHIWIEVLNKRGNMCLKFVPFPEGGARRASFQGGHSTLQSDELVDMKGLYVAGVSRPILVGYTERVKQFPDVPCTKELGIENYIGRWRGFAFKAGTPEPIVKYMSAILKERFESKDYQNWLEKEVGHDRTKFVGPEELKKFVQEETAVFTEIAKDLGWVK